jgi:hypothetical protein
MVGSCHQNVGQSHNVLTDNKPFENVAKFKYFTTTVTNQNGILLSKNLLTYLLNGAAFL